MVDTRRWDDAPAKESLNCKQAAAHVLDVPLLDKPRCSKGTFRLADP